LPALTAVTTPFATVAIAAAPVLHAIVRPRSAALFASRGVAVSVAVPPICTLAVAGVTATLATTTGGGGGGGVRGGGCVALVPSSHPHATTACICRASTSAGRFTTSGVSSSPAMRLPVVNRLTPPLFCFSA